MINHFEKYIFLYVLLGICIHISLFKYRPMCGIAILYKPVFNSCITLYRPALADIGLILN